LILKNIALTIFLILLPTASYGSPVRVEQPGDINYWPANKSGFPQKGSFANWYRAARIAQNGSISFDMGEYKKAAAAFRTAISIYPYDSGFYSNLGWTYSKQHKFKQAEANLHKAIILNPNHWKSWWQLGSVLMQEGKYKESRNALYQALDLSAPTGPAQLRQDMVQSIKTDNEKLGQ
jgi:Flp pilus assembly protein TadD